MKFVKSFVILCFLLTHFGVNYADEDDHDHHEGALLIDPFHLSLEILGIHGDSLNITTTDQLIHRLTSHIECTASVNTTDNCTETWCFNTNEIFTALGIAQGKDILEDNFGDLAAILVYYALTAQNHCNQVVSVNQSRFFYQAEVAKLFRKGSVGSSIDYRALQDVLTDLDDLYESDEEKEHEGHDHEGEDDHDDHTGKTTTSEEDHVTKAPSGDSDDDSHDHSNEVTTGVKTITDKCLSAGRLFDEVKKDPYDDVLDDNDVNNLSQLLLYHLLSGAHISKFCRVLPRPGDFSRNLLDHVHAVNNQIPKTEFEELLTTLGITSGQNSETPADDHGHDHKRRRRSVDQDVTSERSRRSKRAVADNSTQVFAPKCYSADQLLAIYNAPAGNAVPKQTFLDLCPSLLYQQVTGACKPMPMNKTTHGLEAAKAYGYGTLAVFIICLCAIAGILILPCAGRTCEGVYTRLLNVFIGLAVGTLITDAVLHLIPSAFGIHGHEDDGHAHSDSDMVVVVEPYFGYGLIAIAGMYCFYVMEMMFNLIGKGNNSQSGHGHSHTITFDNLEYGEKKLQQNGHKSESKSQLYESQTSVTPSEFSEEAKKKKRWTAVAIMVIVGDALHNFADGLAIGAAFSQSVSTGVATSITVFCHELPHELGDFAILINSGLGFYRALAFNFLSSLTSFVGLYIGVAISTDVVVRQWIFGITAGLFIYIALADMMPTMTGGGQGTRSQRMRNVFFNNVGLFLGVGILVVLSLFEEKIKI